MASMKKFVSLMGVAAFAALVGSPALAQTSPGSNGNTETPFEVQPGPGETPSGSPSVPGVSPVDDPGMAPGRAGQSDTRESYNSRDVVRFNRGMRSGPFQTVPGPSETPSGSPSVPGGTTFADPARAGDFEAMDESSTQARSVWDDSVFNSSVSQRTSSPGLTNSTPSGMQTNGMQMNGMNGMNGMQMNPSTRTQAAAPAFDSQVITQAAQSNNAEIQTSQLALQRATSNEVKQYAQQMIDEHTAANQQLAQIAAQYGVTLPTTPPPTEAAVAQRLAQLSGVAFDRAYLEAQVNAHQRTATLFQSALPQLTEQPVRSYVSALLPRVENHLEMASTMSSAYNARGNGTTPNAQ